MHTTIEQTVQSVRTSLHKTFKIVSEHLSTKQAAEALGVSESSVKRWCDRGAIPTTRTLGGHRRIPLDGFLDYLKQANREVVVPIPGLDSAADGANQSTQPSMESLQVDFAEALEKGDEAACKHALAVAYSSLHNFSMLADDFIASAFHLIGERWDCGEVEIYQERRGCEICSRALHDFRRLVPQPPENAPLAIGGTPAGDNYSLPSQLVELVLRECSWQTMNLGCNLPLETVLAAVEQHKPKMVWLSASHLTDPQKFASEYSKFFNALPRSVLVVLGGRALSDELRPQLQYTGFCDNMQQLAAFASALHGTRPAFKNSDN